jgi:hypothetical protein
MKNYLDERKLQSVVMMEYTFEEVLTTFLTDYECLQRSNDIDSLVDLVCGKMDFNGFIETYCDGDCDGEDYLNFVYNHRDIEHLIIDWSFNKEKFYNDFVVPFKREENLKHLLEH